MNSAPITRPVAVLTTALAQALNPVAPIAADGLPAYGWLRSRQGLDNELGAGTLSGILIAQAATPFKDAGWVGEGEATGGIVIRAVALTDDAAQGLRDDAVAALAALSSVPEIIVPVLAGTHTTEGAQFAVLNDAEAFRVSFTWTQEPVIPPVGARWCAAAQYAVSITRISG